MTEWLNWTELNWYPLSWWCYLTISPSAGPISFCFQSFPASGSFPMSQLFTSGGQRIRASALVLPMNIRDWFPLGLTGLISLCSKGLSRVFLQHHSSKASVLWCSVFFMVQLSHPCVTTGKTTPLTIRSFVNNSNPKRWCCESAALNMPANL